MSASPKASVKLASGVDEPIEPVSVAKPLREPEHGFADCATKPSMSDCSIELSPPKMFSTAFDDDAKEVLSARRRGVERRLMRTRND